MRQPQLSRARARELCWHCFILATLHIRCWTSVLALTPQDSRSGPDSGLEDLGQDLTEQQRAAAQVCLGDKYSALYHPIFDDLRQWREGGITAELMDYTYTAFATPHHQSKGAAVLFEGGRPHLLNHKQLGIGGKRKGHHGALVVAHMLLFEAMARRFGRFIPDVEFVVSTADAPNVFIRDYTNVSALFGGEPIPPIMRFCKADGFADILVPDIHFFIRGFSLVDNIPLWNALFPWPAKNSSLFGRFSPYTRAVYHPVNATHRAGHLGQPICEWRPGRYPCQARRHYVDTYVKRVYRPARDALLAAGTPLHLAPPLWT